MFKQLKGFAKSYENYMIRRARIEAREILLLQDDRTLSDIGIVREELLGGIQNWPWDSSQTTAIASTAAVKKAVNELNSFSDRELADIGINRGMIEDAVANGRPETELQPAPATPAPATPAPTSPVAPAPVNPAPATTGDERQVA